MFLTTRILRAGGGIFKFQNGDSRWPCCQGHQEFPLGNSRESTVPKIPGGNSRGFWRFSKIVIFFWIVPYCVKPVFFELRFGEEHRTVSSCPTFCFMELSNDLLELEVRFTDSISNLFSITVIMTYGNTSLQIALFPLRNSYQLPHQYRRYIGKSRSIHRVRELC